MECEADNAGALSILLYPRLSFGALVLQAGLGREGDQERCVIPLSAPTLSGRPHPPVVCESETLEISSPSMLERKHLNLLTTAG